MEILFYVIILLFICVLLWHCLRFLKKKNKKLRTQKRVIEEHRQEFLEKEKQMWQIKDELLKRISIVNINSNSMEIEELVKYKEELHNYYNDYNMIDCCGNETVNAIIYSNMQILNDLGVTTEIRIHDMDMDSIAQEDLFELFYQIFLIGVEACKRRKDPNSRFFCVKTKRIAGQFVVEIRCSVSDSEQMWNKKTKHLKPLIKKMGGTVLSLMEVEKGMIVLSVPLERGE